MDKETVSRSCHSGTRSAIARKNLSRHYLFVDEFSNQAITLIENRRRGQ